ncbi:MAG: OmpH family outer membrane protein [Paludibacteraceae bacterium]|nr:OmpH family outer membrane protein [Paludibacteraceae bacterium]
MKKVSVLAIALFIGCVSAMAQKWALVDMEYILKNIPAYESAAQQLEQSSKKWQKEIDALNTEADNLMNNYKSEMVFLTPEQKTEKEQAIIAKETEAKDLKRKYFGNDGELYKKRESLMRPIQDEIYNAIKEIAEKEGYMRVDDRASSPSILYANPVNDISDAVLSKMGYAK